MNITITQNIATQIGVCINAGESYFAGGALQTTSGAYQDTFPSSNICDSIVTTNLNVITIATTIADIVACNNYTLNGITYTSSIDVSDTIRNNQGCITNITINSIFIDGNKYDTVTACINPGESYFVGGGNQTNGGVYYDTISASTQGYCPTFRSTFLELIIPQTDTLQTINAIDRILINGTVYTENTVIENVTLSKLGCDSLLQYQPIKIIKTPEGKLFMPNVFSPNGDGVNDLIEPLYNASITILSFKIFNRWGEMIFNGQKGWDGYYNGMLQKPDVYVYTLSATDKSSGKTLHYNGSLTLIM
jgi:gliding motility-associated-like protein